MTLEELLSHETSSIEDMEKYFKTLGLSHPCFLIHGLILNL